MNTDPAQQAEPTGKPRGVLRPSFAQGDFQHHRQAPSPALAGLVEHYWYVAWDLRGLPAQQQATLPHPNIHLVVENGEARIWGVHSGRFMRQLQGQERVFGIKFKAGGFYPFYRQAIATLGNGSIAITDCFGQAGADFCQQILAAHSHTDMCTLAEAFLLQHLPPPDEQVARVSALLANIEQDRSIIAVEQLMDITGMDKRALQRLFQKYVGIGPKWVIQRYRLHEAVAQVQAGKTLSWTNLALELGYFDQAHFVRDFRQLVGMSPGEYERSLG
ncbi:helix-turn-helix domain-containing protein [Undibacterium sp. TS12]|uniref:helix-turn-helix domain-containing protein n=1 Tax=Undibacterium sp. TS12 TaxID=2908202 RepID=UPI001F4D1C2C|nr:helix-turn-helix domain-containing protein [Undibacterium sp. TS12]MCH8620501.1 helix-turn-helix domain-containing protein [Undibacterium sp. TS12]